MKYKKYLSVLSVSIFVASAFMLGSIHSAGASFWDWFGAGNNTQTQQAEVITGSVLLPVADYKFDENSGFIAYDSSGSGSSSTITGATWTDGKKGSGLYFDGINDYVDLGNPASLQSSKISLSVWFNTSFSGMLIRKRLNGYGLEVMSSGKVSFWINNSAGAKFSAISPNIYNNNGWHHAVGVYDGSAVKLYIDGAQVSSATAGAIYYGAGSIAVGRDGDFNGSNFIGRIDEVKIYNRALSSQDVLALYEKESKMSSSSSAQPSIVVLSPNGGETLKEGENYIIKWNSANLPLGATIGISLYRADGSNKTIATNLVSNQQSEYVWKVDTASGWGFGYNKKPSVMARLFGIKTASAEGGYTIMVSAYWGGSGNVYDKSNASFNIISGGSSSMSSTSAGVSVITGVAEYSSTNANLSGSVSNPNKENVSYYFNYRKETETSAQTKQTPWTSVNSASFMNVTERVSNLTPGTKYVYRLYAYSYTTGKTVSGDLKSFTTQGFSSASSSSSGLTAITGNADYSATNATLYGIVNNPNMEMFSYYFNYRKETETSAETKQTPWKIVNAEFLTNNVSASISGLSPGTKYVYRLYAYKNIIGGTVSGDLKSFTTLPSSNSSSSISNPHAEWSLINTSAVGTQSVLSVASSSVTGTINLKAKAIGGSMIKPSAKDFSVAFSGTYIPNGIFINPVVTVTPTDPMIGAGGEYTVSVVGTLYSSDPRFTSSQPVFMAIKNINSIVGGVSVVWGDSRFYTAPVYLPKEGGSSSSSSSSVATIFSPNGGENWQQGTMQEIKYKSNAGYSLNIDLVRGVYEKKYVMNIGKTVVLQCVTTPCGPFNDRYQWIVPQYIAQGNDYFIRIGSEIGSSSYEFSDGPFTISPSIITLPCTTSPCYGSSSSSSGSGGGLSRYIFTRELGYDSSGNDVTELQKRLTSEGYYFGPITGYYGSMTGESVKKYQIANGLTVTGYVGSQTLGVLNGSTVSSTSVSSSSQGTSISQLIELFIALGIISPDKAELARTSVKGM